MPTRVSIGRVSSLVVVEDVEAGIFADKPGEVERKWLLAPVRTLSSSAKFS